MASAEEGRSQSTLVLAIANTILKMSDPEVASVKIDLPPKPRQWIGVRHIQFVMLFMTMVVSYGIRTSLSVAIISMMEETPPDPSIPTYPHWENVDMILSSFFWSYIFPQVAAGQLSEKYGPKWFLFGACILDGVGQLFIPKMAEWLGSPGVIICRLAQGVGQSALYPCLHNMISRWAPLSERASVTNFVYGGSALGNGISMIVTGTFAGSKMGWPVAFYFYGALELTVAIIFGIFASNNPNTHKRVTEEERKYIQSSNSVTQEENKHMPTPWKAIFTSLPVWAIFFAGCSECWGTFTLLTQIPSYMSSCVGFKIEENGQLSSLPYFTLFVLGLLSAPIADRLLEKKVISITFSRKLCNSLGSFLPGAALICLGIFPTSEMLATILLVLSVGTNAFMQSGYLVNLIDVAPNHAGTIVGLVNGANNIFSIVGPWSVGWMGDDKTQKSLWDKVFYIAAAVYIGCGIFYAFFTSGEVQPWNDIPAEDTKDSSKKDPEKIMPGKY